MHCQTSPWTPEIDETAQSNWAKGNSASNISMFILVRHGVTLSRNAVIGRAARKGWVTPKKPRELSGAVKPRRSRAKTRPNGFDGNLTKTMNSKHKQSFPKDDRPLTADTTESRNVELLDLAPHDCRYPTGEDEYGRHLFCGHLQASGSSYCEHHAHIASKRTWKDNVYTPRLRGAPTGACRILSDDDLPHGKSYSEHAGSSC